MSKRLDAVIHEAYNQLIMLVDVINMIKDSQATAWSLNYHADMIETNVPDVVAAVREWAKILEEIEKDGTKGD